MKSNLVVSFCAGVLLGGALQSAPPEPARQMVLVVTKDWTATSATLYRLERESAAGAWRHNGRPVDAMIGRSGLAWDSESRPSAATGPVKREGDGKSPAGVFHLETIYGTAVPDSAAVREFGLPYRQVTADLECVDDSNSTQYNRMVERSRIASPDWNSSERISSLTHSVYRWLAVVDYNSHGVRRGAGSCIFLHVASTDRGPTAGCTAMAEADLLELFAWIDRRKSPVVVQTTAEGLAALQRAHPDLLSRLTL